MKTFKQFLQEAEAETIEDFLIDNCRNFLSELDLDLDDIEDALQRKNCLYRGVNMSSGRKVRLLLDGEEVEGVIKTVRTDRQPLHTDPQVSKIVDDAFYRKFKWRPRSEGVFCFTHAYRNGTAEFGTKCKIFPIGPFEFVYSTSVNDMTPLLARHLPSRLIDDEDDEGGQREYNERELQQIKAIVDDFIREHDYQDSDLLEAMSTGKPEIMIKCASYLAIPVEGDD